ncbi:hypothetical protein K466DRAFT_454795, partial [Polyporus arcularius HHB13444]
PTKSLLPGEPPGFDCKRDQANFELVCNFWSLETWNEHLKSKKGMTSVGKVIGRRGRKPKGTNTDTHGFLENVDGTPAHAREYELARQWAHDVLDMCINLDVDLPASWKDIDIRIKQMCY